MTTTRQDIGRWFDKGKTQGHTHMVVIYDGWDDFPLYLTAESPEDARLKVKQARESVLATNPRVMEVYKLTDDKDEQLSLRRCFRY